jgi:hypothetical protein
MINMRDVARACVEDVALQNQVKEIIYSNILILRSQMLEEFENHPVTQEILLGMKGSRESNISGTLDGHGNLFSFIGFEKGSDPIGPVRNLLQYVNIISIRNIDKSIVYRLEIPTPKDIFSVTPIPWASGRSWVKGIETGISGLGQYYYLKDESKRRATGSRSGVAFQIKGNLRGGGFRKVKYMSDILNRYAAKIVKLENIYNH